MKKGFSETLRYYSDYRLKDYSEISNNKDTLKSKIVSNGAVTVYYPSITAVSYTHLTLPTILLV